LPQLKVTLDNSIEYSVHIAQILNDLNKDRKEQEGEQES